MKPIVPQFDPPVKWTQPIVEKVRQRTDRGQPCPCVQAATAIGLRRQCCARSGLFRAGRENRGRSRIDSWCLLRALGLLLFLAAPLHAQTLLNVDFGVGSHSAKTGFAATGQATNDFWNLYRHYDPKFVPGTKLVPNGDLRNLKLADGADTKIVIGLTNAPGVWGNASGDPMYDAYVFAQNGSNITVAIHGLDAGRYHFYLYGHADPDVIGEQNSSFTVRSGTNELGPLTTTGSNGWKATSAWQERYQYVVFRDVPVIVDKTVFIDVAPGQNGIAVLNGLQIISRGTSPPRLVTIPPPKTPFALTNLLVHEVRYSGKVSDGEARFQVTLDVESLTTNEVARSLFEGDVAVLAKDIPAGLRIVSGAKQYRLICSAPGRYQFKLELVAKITRAEPWNRISFTGPAAAIASVSAGADSPGVEMQLLSGTQLDPEAKATSHVEGFLGPDRQLALRWQGRATEIARKSLVTVDTVATAQITPTVIKFNTQLRYEILQAPLPRLEISLPKSHALTKVQGDQIRDWSLKTEADRQVLAVEFVKPVEKSYVLTLLSEQPVEATPVTAQLVPPQPLAIERESGSFAISADDMAVEIGTATGLRQVNAAAETLAAYRFYGRPFALSAILRRIEPNMKVADRATIRLEETRLLVSHALTLNVEKSGIYALGLTPQDGFAVAEVRGEGVEDWKVADGKLRVNFSARVLGARRLDVQLEQPLKLFPDQLTISPLRAMGATNEVAQVGAASALGIRLKTAGDLTGLREVPVTVLSSPTDEQLAYAADAGDWKLTLAVERLPARVVADIFNLVTVGDGLLGGSAVIRYGIINQGVQEFRVKLPAHWKNVEFTGPNIRRKETNAAPAGVPADTNFVFWTIFLQDKAWGGYTLVTTYDYQFDPKKASLNLGGAHAVGVERETGSIALATAASLQLKARPIADPLRLIDQTELAETDRALITRPVLLAYRYTGDSFSLLADLTRNDEVQGLLNAVADRTQITSVLTEEGQMLSQASFMVKNNDKQFQKFKLPAGASLWGCYVNNQPVKAEQDGEWLLVSLPRGANRDEAFAVDIVYKQTLEALKSRFIPKSIDLAAPKTDVPNTYAEWQLFVPTSQRLSSFAGSMTVQRGTTYDLRDAWNRFTEFYSLFFQEHGAAILFIGGGGVLLVLLVGAAIKSGKSGVIGVFAVICIAAILAGMLLPSLAKSKAKAQRINSVSSLKQIGLAARMFANDNGERFPVSFEEMMKELNSDQVLVDRESGQRFIYVGAGKRVDEPRAIIAYSPVDNNGRAVAFADGSVQQMTSIQFAEALVRDAEAQRQSAVVNLNDSQTDAISRRQGREGESLQRVERPVASATVPGREVRTGDLSFNVAAPGLPSAGVGGAKPASGLSVNGAVAVDGFGAILGQAVNPVAAAVEAGLGGAGNPLSPATLLPPTAAGIRSIRIDLPRTGRMLSFTKVLNISDEPLSIRMSVMKLKAFQAIRSTFQLGFFLAGLMVVWLEWRRFPRRTLRLTVGSACVIGSVTHLAISVRTLHLLFIASLPVLAVLLALWAFRRWWPRKAAGTSEAQQSAPVDSPLPPDPIGPAPLAPPVASIALLLSLSLAFAGSVRADDDEPGKLQPSSLTNAISMVSATYSGTVRDKVAQLDATLILSSIATNQSILLFGSEVAVQQFSTDAREARLVRQGQGVALRLGDKGHATVKLKLVARLEGDVTRRRLAFAIPPALASQLSVTIDEPEADVEFPTAISFQRSTNRTETHVEAILGAGDRVELIWTPRMKRIAEMAASIFAQNTTLVTVGGGAVNTRSVLDYQVTQGELRQVKVKLPVGQRLLRVEGEWIRVWELNNEGGAQILTVDLLKGVSPGYRLTVETEKVLDVLPAQVKVEVPHVQDVIRENGLVALLGGEELSVSIDNAQELQRVDAAEFAKSGAFKADGLVSAYRFFKQGFTLTARAEAIQPHVEAIARNSIRVGFEAVNLSARIDYTIKKAGIFQLRLAVPAGYRVDAVTGNGVSQWHGKPESNTVEVLLKERTMGAFTLQVALSKAHKELPATLEFSGVTPLDVQKLTGFVSVSSEAGAALKTATFEGLTEIPAAALGEGRPSGGGMLGYKCVGTDPATAGAWKLSVSTEVVESWVRAEVANVVSLTETLLSGRAMVRYDIQNAPVKEFRLRIPTNYANVEITGPNIRRRDRTNDLWRVELQNKVRGVQVLTVTWEQARPAKTNGAVADLVNFTGVEAVGVERETGVVILMTRPPLQVTEKSALEPLVRIDVRELPDWSGVTATSGGAGGEVPVLVYRYLRPGYALGVEAKRFNEAAVLQALVDSARFTTVVADDGQMMTEMVLGIRNNGLQHLEVELPADAAVWSAFVAGQPVRPATQNNKVLLPLERSGADDAPVSVELTYVGRQAFPRGKGNVKLASPKLDVPLKNARWDLYLPPDYNYSAFAGSMAHEASEAPVVQVYSSLEYRKQEDEKKVAKKSDLRSFLSSARSRLAEGKLKVANEEFNNASRYNKDEADGDTLRELAELKKELGRSQSSNLIQAQRAYSAENAKRLSGKAAAADAPAEQLAKQVAEQVRYDAEAAEQQWGALQRAQELTVAKVQPLRANLPTRGLRHSFSQVLQTEVGKEMTIQFSAANAKETGWFKQLVYFTGGFLLLWIFVNVVANRPGTRPARA